MKIQLSLPVIRILVILIIFTCIAVPMVSATIFTKEGSELSEGQLHEFIKTSQSAGGERMVTYFYDPYCESCLKAEAFIEPYLSNHPDVKIVKYNVSNGTEEMDLFNQGKAGYNREKVFIPVMYFGPVALEGPDDIARNFEDVYAWYTRV